MRSAQRDRFGLVALLLILGVMITFLIDVYLESPPALYSMTILGIVMTVIILAVLWLRRRV